MGCDIHLFAEVKIKGVWHFFADLYDFRRNYSVFARMAICGREMAVVPIVPNKGIPEDISPLTALYLEYAEHSYSWFDKAEIAVLLREFPHLLEWEDGRCPTGEIFFKNWLEAANDPGSLIPGIEDVRWVFGFDN